MTTSTMPQVGAAITVTKEISEADVALFSLVTDDHLPAAEEPAAAEAEARPVVPHALIAALLAAAAARHAGGLDRATIAGARLSCSGTTHAGDTLAATAEVTACDASSGVLGVRAHCDNQAGERVGEGTFELRADG
jgi:acyl dehydratase